MIRNLKGLGLVLAAVFVVGAVHVSAASASFITADAPMTLTGSETGTNQNRMTFFGNFIECPGSTYTVHKYNVTPHVALPSSATSATLTPHYKQTTIKDGNTVPNCVGPFGMSATIDMNGCDYVVALGTATGGGATYGITFDVVCPVGKEIQATLWTSVLDHTTNKPLSPFCVIDIPPQTGLSGAHATVTPGGHIDIVGTVEKVKAKRTNQDHPLSSCTNAEEQDGKIDLDIKLIGKNEAEEEIEVSISE